MSGETQRQDDASEGDGRAWTPPPPHETPEPRLDDRYSSNLSQRPTPLAALDDLDAEDRAGFEELAERLKVARQDPKNVRGEWTGTTPRELNPSPSPHEARPRARRSPLSLGPLWMMRTPCATRSAAVRRRRDRPPIGVRSRPPSKLSLHLRPTSTRCDGTWPPCGRASRCRAPHGSSLPPLASR